MTEAEPEPTAQRKRAPWDLTPFDYVECFECRKWRAGKCPPRAEIEAALATMITAEDVRERTE